MGLLGALVEIHNHILTGSPLDLVIGGCYGQLSASSGVGEVATGEALDGHLDQQPLLVSDHRDQRPAPHHSDALWGGGQECRSCILEDDIDCKGRLREHHLLSWLRLSDAPQVILHRASHRHQVLILLLLAPILPLSAQCQGVEDDS